MAQKPEAAEESSGQSLPDPGDCKQELDRILGSPDFDATDRERRFLAYVVEETLAGRGDRIKAYSIAVSVFGRGESFNPQTDPIVRVEAGHLRRALHRYYLASGSADPLVIAIPKGSYIPSFELPTHRAQTEASEPALSRGRDITCPPRSSRRGSGIGSARRLSWLSSRLWSSSLPDQETYSA